MLFKIKSYLKFFLKSTNQHGVHSPFVFDYVTKCLYTRTKLDNHKSNNVLLKSLVYFNFSTIQVLDNTELQQKVKLTYPNLEWNSCIIDMLYTQKLDVNAFEQLISVGKIHNHSMILVDGIHINRENEKQWEQLIQKTSVSVSIDLYHCGVLFTRKEQVKEHFIIRI